ncbi:TlpA family protein disulfide reductase [Patescibacteria group bacterium]|nr:TlpA family protein disulfide reductase [Patescibacteria group bacterium]
MNNKILIIGAIIITVGLLVFGRWYSTGQTQEAVSIGTQGQANVRGGTVSIENPAPDFSLQKLGGGTITLAEYRGKKPVVLDFWASWCPNCRRDMPKLSRFYEKYKDQVEVIGINLQENKRTIENYINSAGISFPVALDPSGRVSRAFGIRYTNIHVLIDKEGNIVRTIPGDIRESDIISLIQ